MIRDYRDTRTGKVKTEYICGGCTYRSDSDSGFELVDVEYPDVMIVGTLATESEDPTDYTLLLCHGCIAFRKEQGLPVN